MDRPIKGSPANPPRSDECPGKSGPTLTDAEVICAFMEPLAAIECTSGGQRSMLDWWRRETAWSDTLKWKPWVPCRLTLDACHEVEARLSEDQRDEYVKILLWDTINPQGRRTIRDTFGLMHAKAEQKVKALAVVMRSAMPNPGGPKEEADASNGLPGGEQR